MIWVSISNHLKNEDYIILFDKEVQIFNKEVQIFDKDGCKCEFHLVSEVYIGCTRLHHGDTYSYRACT